MPWLLHNHGINKMGSDRRDSEGLPNRAKVATKNKQINDHLLYIPRSLTNAAEYVSKWVRNDALHLRYRAHTFHCKGFTSTSLAIRKDSSCVWWQLA